jgi:hypothetical protein
MGTRASYRRFIYFRRLRIGHSSYDGWPCIQNEEFIETSINDLTLIVYGLHNGLSMIQHDQDADRLYQMYHMAIDILLKGIAK